MSENQTIKDRLITFIAYLGIGQGKFEKECELANGYVNNIRKSITPEKLQQITLRYPQLNGGWLMTGEGEMLKNTSITQTSHGNNSPNIANNKGNVNVSYNALGKALDEIKEQRKLVIKSQEQIDRLLSVIENLTK